MHKVLIDNWNSKVKPTDTIYIIGDLSLCHYKNFEPIAKQLQGHKILIKGNHDHYSDGQYNKVGFQVYHEVKLKLAGHMIRLSHYPYALPWHRKLFAYASELRFMDRRPPKIEGEWLIHGHTHTKKKLINNMIHVGVDAWDFKPVSIREIESLIAKIIGEFK